MVAAGQSGGKVLVERFTTGGQPDGVYVGPAGYARAVAIESDGTIAVAGQTGKAMLVERLTAGLTPDSRFGAGGIATTVLGGTAAVANGVAIGSGGSIVAAGAVSPTGVGVAVSPDTRVGVARFSSSGALVSSNVLNFGPYSAAEGVAVQQR